MPTLVTTGPSIFYAPAFALAFLVLARALGRKLMRWLGVASHEDALESSLTDMALGTGALQFVPFALGACGWLGARGLQLALLALALLLAPELGRTVSGFWRWLRTRSRPSAWQLACFAALAPTILVALLLALTPTIDPDGLGYHLTVPRRWLEHKSLSYLPTYPYSNTPMGVEMLFTIALVFAGDAAAKTLHFALGLLGGLGLYATGKRLRSPALGATAALLYLVGPAGAGAYLGWAYLEGAIAFALTGSVLAWCIWWRERRPGWLACAFALAGVSVSFKISAVLFPIALFVLTLSVLSDARPRVFWPALRPVSWAAVPVVPWLVRSALVTGNPVFPLFASIIPSRDYSPRIAQQFEQYNRYMLWGSRLLADWGPDKRRLVLVALGLAIVAVAAVVYKRLDSRLARTLAVVSAATALIQLSAVGLYLRYWVPILSVMQLPLLLAAMPIVARRRAQALLLGLAAVSSLVVARRGLASTDWSVAGSISTIVGAESQQTFLTRHIPLYPLYETANRDLPASARIMLSSYCGGFYLERTTYCAEFLQESLRLTTWSEFSEDVRRLGITHVLAPTSLLVGQGPAPNVGGSVSEILREQQNALVGRLLREHAQLLATASDQGLYALRVDSI